MLSEKEIKSLIDLLDDPDEEIYGMVEEKILSLGSHVIESLEEEWEGAFEPLKQSRIEYLIHKIQFSQTVTSLRTWYLGGAYDLLEGLLIVNRYQYPDKDEQEIINILEEIKRDVWLEMIYNMSAVEKVRLLNNVLYNKHGFRGNTKNYHDPENSYIGRVLETKRGNPILLASIYSIIAQKVDLPVYGVNLPRHFILAYLDEDAHHEKEVLFYINAFNRGQIFGKHDVFAFLKQLNLPNEKHFFEPCDNLAIITRVLRNLLSSYSQSGTSEKVMEIQRLLDILGQD
ncbi:transglutaminase-like domain-containing protein [Olivibacter sitiensis]|uniref:transglutaminase-like domain-containing protein n=1 Tax=Olivibacter sitiensis TaxID=376470 RepID=UPI00048421AB|nr:transglutaminase-like domain-containing protein [Olivibacter sitiensis]